MLNLLNSLGLAKEIAITSIYLFIFFSVLKLYMHVCIWIQNCTLKKVKLYLLLDRHLLGGAGRLDRHGGLKRDSGGGVRACFRGLHGA